MPNTTTTTTPSPCDSQKQFFKIQLRRGNEAEFISNNPILASGEPAYSVDTKQFKIGDGQTNWSDLSPFVNAQAVSGIVIDVLNEFNVIVGL